MKKLFLTIILTLSVLMGFSQEIRLVAVSRYYNSSVCCSFKESERYCHICDLNGLSHWHYYTYVHPNITYIAYPTMKVYHSQPVYHSHGSYHKPPVHKPAPKPSPSVHHQAPPKSSNSVRTSTQGFRPASSSSRTVGSRSTTNTRR